MCKNEISSWLPRVVTMRDTQLLSTPKNISFIWSQGKIYHNHNLKMFLLGCIPLIWSRSVSVIRDHLDHGRSNEQMNPCPGWIHRFIWSSMIQVISDHWSWSGSSQRNAPLVYKNWIIVHHHLQEVFIHNIMW